MKTSKLVVYTDGNRTIYAATDAEKFHCENILHMTKVDDKADDKPAEAPTENETKADDTDKEAQA